MVQYVSEHTSTTHHYHRDDRHMLTVKGGSRWVNGSKCIVGSFLAIYDDRGGCTTLIASWRGHHISYLALYRTKSPRGLAPHVAYSVFF
jgi:hypothetical protein